MYDKHSKTIIEVLKQNEVYIIKYIIKSLNEFVLIFIIYTVKRWHHTNSIAIMSYISNTLSNPRSASMLICCLLSFS